MRCAPPPGPLPRSRLAPVTWSRRLRWLAPRLALLLFTCAVIVAVGELAARIAILQGVVPEEPLDPDLPVVDTLAELRKPDWEGVYKGAHHRSNSQGMRGPEYRRRAAPGEQRIGVVGDSITMGQGVPEAARYSDLLEARLAEAGARIEVLNMGMSGANTVASARRLARLGGWYGLDLAIYGFTINDIEGPRYRHLDAPETARKTRTMIKWELASRYEDSPSYLLRWVWPRWVLMRGFDDLKLGLVDRTIEHNYFDNPEARADMLDGLDRMVAFAEARGICLVVFLHTHLAELGPKHPYARVYETMKEEATRRGLPVIESFDAFEGRDETRLWVSRTDSHPNREGHEILADALFDGLLELPAPCGFAR